MPSKVLRVAADSRVPAVAGAIAGVARGGEKPVVYAVAAAAVNQAIKAIITARAFLREEGIDLSFVPSFSTQEGDEGKVAIRLDVEGRSGPIPRADSTDLTRVASHSHTTAVAGALAGKIRDEKAPNVQAVGAAALNQAVKAIALASSYLQQEAVDIFCVPSFVEVEIDGRKKTAIRLAVRRVNEGKAP